MLDSFSHSVSSPHCLSQSIALSWTFPQFFCCTRAKNATHHTGLPDLPAKQCSKAEKAEDNKCLKDAQAAKERANEEGVQCLALVEIEAEEKTAAAAAANKPKAVRPCPCPRPRPWVVTKTTVGRSGIDAASHVAGNDGLLTDRLQDNASTESDPEVVSVAATQSASIPKKPVSLKEAIKEYKLNHKKKQPVNGSTAKHMFLLTESTLFFLNLALNGRASKNVAPGWPVKHWAVGVAHANSVAASSTSASTTHTPPPPSTTNTTNSITLCTSATTSLSNHSYVPVVSTNTPETTSLEIFGDNVDELDEWAATLSRSKGKVKNKEALLIIPASESDNDVQLALPPKLRITSSSIKRKADTLEAVDIVSYSKAESNSHWDADTMKLYKPAPKDIDTTMKIVEPGTLSKGMGHHTTTSTSVVIVQAPPPPQKKAKIEESCPVLVDVPAPSTKSNPPINIAASNYWAQGSSIQYDTNGYIVEVIKKRNKYSSKDLPVPSDSRWSHGVIAMIMLWCSVQPNMWSIPEEDMVTALQVIFDTVYPGIKYRVNPAGSVFVIGLQQVSEWRSGFGSTALAMMIDFFPNGVIALRSAALERAVQFIMDGTIKVEQVLTDMTESSDGKMRVVLPKVLNKATGRETSELYMFSATNWGGNTASYKESILKRGTGFTCDMIVAVQRTKSTNTCSDMSSSAGGTPANSVNPAHFSINFYCCVL
ncbi:hypothetical protein PAXINDRAFT_16761 [Paxillus involutus ATCC 200175]|uniref:Uncharacterized protein n=1 Tax=Paxillus involutus ATCC 200175 TaxID=664439 RepID=A0A0C9TSQ5_PAXIN|nr:hypothetical protein PAXINDRAFT_16761 [Paxillus involutus ATCC 200175]